MLRRATATATKTIPLRPNRVHPLWRTDHDNNVGIGAPEIEFGFEPEGDWIDLVTVHKGGQGGSLPSLVGGKFVRRTSFVFVLL